MWALLDFPLNGGFHQAIGMSEPSLHSAVILAEGLCKSRSDLEQVVRTYKRGLRAHAVRDALRAS